MKKTLYILLLWCAAYLPISTIADTERTELLEYTGSTIEEPYWFKDSFLDISEDLQEAKEEGKQLIIYFHQAGCPYCFNLVQQSFLDPQLSQFIQTHFDVVALNLWGDREVTLPNGDTFTEKQLATQWSVQFTPTLFFYKSIDEEPLRINGYRSKEALAKVFDYILSDTTQRSLAQTIISNEKGTQLYPSADFKKIEKLATNSEKQPVALLFEYPGCSECEQFHKQVLSRKDTHELLSEYQTYRVDLSNDNLIEIKEGQFLTPQQWADHLGLTYFPSVVLYNDQLNEKLRIDSYVQHFHFHTALEYVSLQVYLRMPEFQRYINERADRLRLSGKKVKITE